MNNNKYIKDGAFYFYKDTKGWIRDFINEAYNRGCRIRVTYKKGFEDFTGYHSKDGLSRSFKIGRSTGEIKIPLEIIKSNSRGGSAFTGTGIEKISFC